MPRLRSHSVVEKQIDNQVPGRTVSRAKGDRRRAAQGPARQALRGRQLAARALFLCLRRGGSVNGGAIGQAVHMLPEVLMAIVPSKVRITILGCKTAVAERPDNEQDLTRTQL